MRSRNETLAQYTKHTTHKVPDEMMKCIKDHINFLAYLEPHYCHANLENVQVIVLHKNRGKKFSAVKASFHRNIFEYDLIHFLQAQKKSLQSS